MIIKKEFYIPMHDGLKLAAYLFFPSGVDSENMAYPVLWKHDRYHSINADQNQLKLKNAGVDFTQFIEKTTEEGFVVAFVDSRGSGCSFGQSTGVFTDLERIDMHSVRKNFSLSIWATSILASCLI